MFDEYVDEMQYKRRMQEAKKYSQTMRRKAEIKEEKNKYKSKKTPISMSKKLVIGFCLIALQIIIFCEFTMIFFRDTTALYALIGIVTASCIPVLRGYFNKSRVENSAGGIIFEKMRQEMKQASDIFDDAQCCSGGAVDQGNPVG